MCLSRTDATCVFILKDMERKRNISLYFVQRSYITPLYGITVTKWQVAGVQFNFKIFINFVDIFQIAAQHFKVFYDKQY